ncbi:PREDICTED: uncharacterized protein LOC109152490 [Ipomoea nil]|uniref:uncharacterized protein LOC109152490 n=1 Tax=Ipomoea nil TaxID=35883 RepID=UPI000900DF7A|nr:PREDICTED: uncharacterized protein LOC109152490 [Ipomoea nil]
MKDIMKRAGMVDYKLVGTPISSAKLTDEAPVPYADPMQYRSLAGALQYLTHMHAPTTADWAALKRVFRYVNGTLHIGLCISRSNSLDIHAYLDSDWAGNPDDRKSIRPVILLCVWVAIWFLGYAGSSGL